MLLLYRYRFAFTMASLGGVCYDSCSVGNETGSEGISKVPKAHSRSQGRAVNPSLAESPRRALSCCRAQPLWAAPASMRWAQSTPAALGLGEEVACVRGPAGVWGLVYFGLLPVSLVPCLNMPLS